MRIDEVKDMLPQKPERMESVEEPKRSELVKASYDLIGCLHEVYKELGAGLPEYIYQEAVAKVLKAKGLVFHKEMKFHPTFMGEQLESYIKMDLVVESPAGNTIVECKALTQLTEKEHYQTFGYLRATKFPIAILVNFGTDRRAQIERFHYADNKLYVF
ncbi:MAG: GxxExxY protein [Paludibacteraceae bacterium]|nr:GxxExxY protein [Paludibacteraceae bacterium]